MYRENYISALQTELLDTVRQELSPVAFRYGYSDAPLDAHVKWLPQVLVLGNYSSGKSTLINEFLGGPIQATGQAPTDDSFTVLTYDERANGQEAVRVTEERDGKFLLNDPEYPFGGLKKHGQRFASHFRLKKVNSPFLKHLAVIDTPGMLDSITERDRGYDYQQVIGDLAQMADLVLVLFDPHKAGTVREAHISLRETLPARTFEDRVLYVLNRIDECASLMDLLQVYGTLCWNLSQITGRKDIPPIRLTYSPHAQDRHFGRHDRQPSYLQYLENQREELKEAILEAPRHRLDHLAEFIETHAERLAHLLEALLSYRRRLRTFRFKYLLGGFVGSLLVGGVSLFALQAGGILGGMDLYAGAGGGALISLVVFFGWVVLGMRHLVPAFHSRQLESLDRLTTLGNQTRRDSWEAVRQHAHEYLERTGGKYSLGAAKHDHAACRTILEERCPEFREALKELALMGDHGQSEAKPLTATRPNRTGEGGLIPSTEKVDPWIVKQ